MKIINIKGTIIPKQNKWIYDWLEYPYTTTDDVVQALQQANNDDIEVHINCYGGSVYDGYEIYTALREYPGNVLIKIVGLAASAASFIAMARECVMSPLAEMMIHNASTSASGPHQAMDSTSQMLQVTDSTIAKAYTIKSGKSEEEMRALMEKETWLTADQAKELGLIDGIMFEEDDTKANIVPTLYNSLPIPSLKAIEELEKCGSIEEFKKKLASNADELKRNISKNQTTVVNAVIDNNKGGKTMDLENFKKDYPDLYNQVLNEGMQQGVTNERERIKAIEDLAIPGNEDILNKAKFHTGVTAEQVAVEIIKAQKNKGNQYLTNLNDDITNSNVNKIDGAIAPQDNKSKNDVDDEEATKIAESMNKRRGNK